jgi:reverse gyrase
MQPSYPDIPTQRPSGGCNNCGGPIRTSKPIWGWVCSRCLKLVSRREVSRS